MEPDKQAQFDQVANTTEKLTTILDSIEHSKLDRALFEEGQFDVYVGIGKILTAIEGKR